MSSLSASELVIHPEHSPVMTSDPALNRRADVEAKQTQVCALLEENNCDGLLVFEPENFSWLSSGGLSRGVLDPAELPVLYFSRDQRWVLSGNLDSQRLFDEELDGLGFQLKEWPWHWGRRQLVADVVEGRKIACDQPFENAVPVGDQLRRLRRPLSHYEQACLRALGPIVSHAVEATCRSMIPNITEREVAGQVSHRLIHRGALPILIGVAADGRSRVYRQFGFTEVPIRRHAVVIATARKYGLCVSTSRSVSFGPPEELFRKEHDAASKIHATYVASTWPDAGPREILGLGRRVYLVTGFEHEWHRCSQGHVTGRSPVELALTPETDELFQAGWAMTWRASVGAACSCDTFLITDKGPELITITEGWPLKRIRIQGADFVRPFILERPKEGANSQP